MTDKRYISGRDAAHSFSTLPAWTSSDLLREIYVEDTKTRYYGTNEGWKEYGGSGVSNEQDTYQDLLSNSSYLNCSFDGMDNQTYVDTINSTMDYEVTNTRYSFTEGEILQSIDLYDDTLLSTMPSATECMISVDVSGSGSVSLSATSDGANWESITNEVVHTFTNIGANTLKIRGVATGTGFINSWGILYNPDTTGNADGATIRKYLPIHYEGVAQDEDVILDGFYFDNDIGVDKITLFSRIAPTGADLTVDLLKDGVEQSKIATLTDASTYEKTTLSLIEYYTTTERFGLKIKQIGSTEDGQSLIVIVHYYDR